MTTAFLPSDERRSSRLAFLYRWLAARRGVDASAVAFGAGCPRIRVKNEGGAMRLGSIFLAPGVRLWTFGGELTIGDGTVLDEGAEVIAWQKVDIGRNCYVGWGVLIVDTDLHGIGGGPVIKRPVSLADNVHVGCRAVILKGVQIGAGAVVMPGAVVTRDIPPGGVARPAAGTLKKRMDTGV